MSIVHKLAAGMNQHRAKTTMQVHNVSQMDKAVRVVASFNRMPSKEEASALIEQAFHNKLAIVPNSFRVRKQGQRVMVAGYLAEKAQTKPVTEAASFKEIAKNVFMDPADQSIWTTNGGQIVRTATENLAELASLAPVAKSLNKAPEEALASVKPFVGPTNTQVVAYVDPEDPEDVKYGVRVDEDTVYSEDEGLAEVTQDMVVDTESLNGMDLDPELATAAVVGDTQSMTDYYAKVYAYDAAYFEQVKGIIAGRALV